MVHVPRPLGQCIDKACPPVLPRHGQHKGVQAAHLVCCQWEEGPCRSVAAPIEGQESSVGRPYSILCKRAEAQGFPSIIPTLLRFGDGTEHLLGAYWVTPHRCISTHHRLHGMMQRMMHSHPT